MKNPVICVVGLGYVGLPLAHALAIGGYTVFGYDINAHRIEELKKGNDWTGELQAKDLAAVQIAFGTDASVIQNANIVIVTVPTPVDKDNKPDLSPVVGASETVGKNLKKGAIVCFESTVYPGVTEELCGPILERESGLTCGKDFTLGYSPERINPGDKEHTVRKIAKVVGGQDNRTTDILCELYSHVTSGGIHRAPSIKVAEMAKAIENAQRDINIAFINEIALLCGKIGISTKDVLEAAKTKWNFLPFQPGLVGGHCIGVDPYYLVEKARQLGMHTQVIAAGRGINDAMGAFVADQVLDVIAKPARILVLGITFKENVPDTRNSKVCDVIRHLEKNGCEVLVEDPYASEHDIEILKVHKADPTDNSFDAVLLLVPHAEFLARGTENIAGRVKLGGLVYDVKSVLKKETVELGGKIYRAL
jgi:UDP-N-acetyl-D-galactosamine dehydrogenase